MKRSSAKTLDSQATVPSNDTPGHEPHSTTHREPLELEGYKFNLSEEKVFEEATLHNNFVYLDKSRLSGLPRFDSLSVYDVKDEDYEKLLRLEIKNLINTAELEAPYLFNSAGRLGLCNTASYEELSLLARRISLDCSVIALDNATMVIDNRPKATLVSLAVSSMKQPCGMLRHEYVTGEKYNSSKPQSPDDSEASRKLYFAFVDFVIGSVARLLIRTASSAYWSSQTLGPLAQMAVKLKFLSKDSREYAHRAITRVEETMRSFQQSDEHRTTIVIQEHVEGKGIEEKHLQMSDDLALDEIYFIEGFIKRGCLHGLFQSAICSLQQNPIRRCISGDFHQHAVAYETGFDRSLVIVSEDREGYVTTTSAAALTRTCCRALTLVKKNIEMLPGRERPPSSSAHTGTGTEFCNITWDWAVKHADNTKPTANSTKCSRKFETKKLDSIISVMIPLALSTPYVASTIEELVQYTMAHSTRKTEEPVRRFKHSPIEASFSIQTSFNARMQKKMRDQDSDTVSINYSDLIGRLKGNSTFR
ncbi:hypothetical protein N0V83_002454 [Neocucurbitaria cava]|uniref:Uncharacterized protein n=1 Tax=Neocucurbitaria cava TaxID=798079 RepID=A0A9W9CQU6_9PLEO|nr:hypothetical protein N0V83_002454 [Neocucurbitaria cava]